ncbi:MAG: UDP-N-acetylmuramoyl-L-alanyl-D-glutamate--2,6-diaminopimelate ligase, partial [Bacteroidetes bacterium]|nr:UDP-N-acetylmuramoyl-L-alanyl-D-glutamate--2,6-diaminopimelate ligase [Bacteroidota bacterium]
MDKRSPHITLEELLTRLSIRRIEGDPSVFINDLHLDSREIKVGDVFIAYKGNTIDRHDFIDRAISAGAKGIICEKMPAILNPEIVYVEVANLKEVVGIIASEYFGNPSDQLKMVAVTGTNGKTSVATMGYQAVKNLGYKAGLLSTTGMYLNDEHFQTRHTTPDPISLHRSLAEIVDAGCEWCWMEASSHALDQGRTVGIDFQIGIFTNLSHDH